jgi:drug/metabolite transporter (DMT)-like permease
MGMLVGSLLFIILVIGKREAIRRSDRSVSLKCTFYGAVAGVANGMYNYLVLCLAAAENATVLFPIISVSTIAMSLISGRILFKERLTLPQIIGVLVSMVAILFIKL